MTTDVVTVFLRHGPAVLLLERSSEVGSYAGQWGAVAGHAEGDPDEAARRELREEAGVEDATVVRRGDPFEVHDPDHGTWRVHPFLVDAESRSVATNWETASHEWVPPTEIRRRDTVPDLWASYDAVRPTVETVAGDGEHGSAYVSLRALDVLRDEAALADDYDDAAAVARDLRDARPGMAVVRNRVNRAIHEADRTPASVEASALAVAREAVDADDRAAARAAAELGDAPTVFTLSRSGTVLAALRAAGPDRVVVAESRPGGEGVAVAEALAAEGFDVTLTGDANVPATVTDCDAVLAGADAVSGRHRRQQGRDAGGGAGRAGRRRPRPRRLCGGQDRDRGAARRRDRRRPGGALRRRRGPGSREPGVRGGSGAARRRGRHRGRRARRRRRRGCRPGAPRLGELGVKGSCPGLSKWAWATVTRSYPLRAPCDEAFLPSRPLSGLASDRYSEQAADGALAGWTPRSRSGTPRPDSGHARDWSRSRTSSSGRERGQLKNCLRSSRFAASKWLFAASSRAVIFPFLAVTGAMTSVHCFHGG